MTDKKLTVLGIVAIIMVILVGVQSGLMNQKAPAPTQQGFLMQGLNTDSVAIILISAGDSQVTLTRDGDAFTIANNDDYPAMTSQVNDMLAQCLDIKTLELVTSNPSNHKEIGVTEDSARYVVKFVNANNEPLAGILISETNPDTKNAFARLLSSDDVYLIENIPWLYTNPGDYIDKQILKVNQAEIVSVDVSTVSGDYKLQRAGGTGDIEVADMPDGVDVDIELARKVFAALTEFAFSKVQKADAVKLDFTTTYKCTLKDTTVYTISIARKKDSFFATCGAEFMDQSQVKMERGVVESEEQLKSKEAKLLAKRAAENFDKLHAGWVYEIPAFYAENLTKHLSDLLKEQVPTETSDDISENISDVESLMQM